MSTDPEVLFSTEGCAGLITLNRPQALNALTLGMVHAMHAQLDAWARDDAVAHVIVEAAGGKAFCAGGDIRQLYDWGKTQDARFLDFYRDEYRLNAFIKNYPKPYIALLDGIVMGGGVGVSIHGSHRVGADGVMFAMPETGIGLFPDVGGTYFLPRLPGQAGLYLGLTGTRLKLDDFMHLGLGTHHVPSHNFAALKQQLASNTDCEAVLQGLAIEPGPAPIASQRTWIDTAFGAGSVEAVLRALDEMSGDAAAWAEKTASILRAKSPTSLKLTYRQIREGAGLSFAEAMKLEFRLVNRVILGHDFFEGTRAVVIDKDNAPRWSPASLQQVGNAEIDAYFAPLGAQELSLN